MKKAILNPVLIIVLTISVFISGCSKKSNVAPADPTGTIITNLGIGNLGMDLLYNSTNGQIILALTSSLDFNVYNEEVYSQATVAIADIGAVSGLGAITSHASGGYSDNASAIVGDGYVVEIVNFAPVPQYYRIYVQSFQLSTSGAVLGATIKYQGPF